jgi:hypothetical protein
MEDLGGFESGIKTISGCSSNQRRVFWHGRLLLLFCSLYGGRWFEKIGKVIATVKQVDEAIGWTRWPEHDHESMGKQSAKDVSWTALLDRLGLSESAFRDADIIDLTAREIE